MNEEIECFQVVTNTDVDGLVNEFIKKWCGEWSAHLIDNDENDGQRLRVRLSLLIDKAYLRGAKDMAKAVKIDNEVFFQKGESAQLTWTKAIREVDRKAQQFIDSLEGK